MKVLRLCLVKESEQNRLVSEQFVINEIIKIKREKHCNRKHIQHHLLMPCFLNLTRHHSAAELQVLSLLRSPL